ncbi:metalloregulator ArsR/SmtB family transcription factor [Halosquirtibacter xylanolyticus]|uniref:ArsR/SmtB family transcription factor n=1 Tax=Halosquirtibacter xylanolyticus TaxID=3374599 RepID=UPI00374972BC|nr:metalloregulator ArsR/SmtB family transcription factor [Prolixibacteraceae bacterium]
MGITKTNLFSDRQNRIANYAKAIGHPARVAIIEYLLCEGKCINKSLVEELGLSQATISQHLKELKHIGLIQGEVEGHSVHYCLNKDNWKLFEEELGDLLKNISTQKITCKSQ